MSSQDKKEIYPSFSEELDTIIASYNISNKSTPGDIINFINHGNRVKKNIDYLSSAYRIFVTDFPSFLKFKFEIKPFIVKKNNPIIFFDTKKGKISICFTIGCSSDEAFELGINGEKRNSFRNTKDLIKEIPKYL